MAEDESTASDPASSLQEAPQVRPEGRSARIARDVLQATIQILIETGGKDLSLERVAERANVNRATLYRRWKSKERLMTWSMLEFMDKAAAQPDEGNIEDDLVAMAMRLATLESSPLGAALMQIIAVESKRDEAVREALLAHRDDGERRIARYQLVMSTCSALRFGFGSPNCISTPSR